MLLQSQTSLGSSHHSSITTDSDVDGDQEGIKIQSLGWKAFLLLQFQIQFELLITVGMYLSYIASIIDFTFAFSTNVGSIPQSYSATAMSFIYIFDVVYVIDLLSMISYKNSDWYEIKHLYPERHTLLIMLDAISVIPLDAVYYSLTETSMQIIYILRLRYALRIFRLIGKLHKMRNSIGNDNVQMTHIEFGAIFSLGLITVACLLYYTDCLQQVCTYSNLPLLIDSIYRTCGCVTSKGLPPAVHVSIKISLILTIACFVAFVYLYGFVVGRLLSGIKQKLQAYQTFINIRETIMKKVENLGTKDTLLLNFTKEFFSIHWKNRKTFHVPNVNINILPEIMGKEISLDIEWDGLKHSHLFRDKEVHLLRFIASMMKPAFLVPGEPIFQQNQHKSAMIYVVTGVVQILSVKDGETPILSFSGGTCFGESTLFFDYPSTCTVICQNYCEIHVLHRKDFIKIIDVFPREYRKMLQTIKDRYAEAELIQANMTKIFACTKQERALLSLRWLKVTLQDLFSKDDSTSESKKQQKSDLDKYLFCPKYLDMLVISDQFELVTDTVFLRESCPCILQPESFVVIGWNTFIALLTMVFAFIYPYYACFQPNASSWYLLLSYTISALYVIDVYIIISTGIRTTDGLLSDISSIAFYKLNNPKVFLDFLAILPTELIVRTVMKSINNQTFVLLQALKLLKLYRTTDLFNESSSTYQIGGIYVKFTLYLLLLVYYTAGAIYLSLCFNNVCRSNGSGFIALFEYLSVETVYNKFIICIYLATQHIAMFGVELSGLSNDVSHAHQLLIVIQIISLLFQINFISNAAIKNMLENHDKLRLQEYVRNVHTTLNNLKVNPKLYKQIFKRLHCQVQYNNGIDLLYSLEGTQKTYLKELLEENKIVAFADDLKALPLFQELPMNVVNNVSRTFKVVLFGPDEIITYAGEVCKEMMYIRKGFCKVLIDPSKREFRVIGPGSLISGVEVCFNIPVMNTIITTTYCELLVALRSDILQNLHSFPEVIKEIDETVKEVWTKMNVEETIASTQNFQESLEDIHDENETNDVSSFKCFGYKLKPETRKHNDFHGPFDKLKYFGFIRYGFLRYTFHPYGKFMIYWEISRCIFAFIFAILTTMTPISTCTHCGWFFVFIFLTLTAWLDLILRHYVCYFDKRGIEITHPLKTATHYLTHGFIVDLLGILDLRVTLLPLFDAKPSHRTKLLFRCTRLIQIHRVINGIYQLDKNIMAPSKTWTIIKFLPIAILLISILSGIIINVFCEFDPNIPATNNFVSGVTCLEQSWITKSNFIKPLDSVRVYLYGIYFITSTVLGPGLGGFHLQSVREAVLITVLTLFGFWIFVIATSKIITTNLLRNADLTNYQETMKTLVEFLANKRIDPKLRSEAIEHFEYIWRTRKGKSLHKVISNFNLALQEDVLYDVYHRPMTRSAVFKGANSSFFRSLLLNAHHLIIMKRGIISKVNDVHDKVFFVVKGHVEVLGPDYNRLLVLPVGSLFGNIDSPRMTRQTLTMVAKGHVELLWIDSKNFHSILSNYYTLKSNYRKLVIINTDYLPGSVIDDQLQYASVNTIQSVLTNASVQQQSTVKLEKIFLNIKQSYYSAAWEIFVIIGIGYMGTAFELYRSAFHMHDMIALIVIYLIDVLYIIHIGTQFHVGYEDEFGVLITDKRKIAKRYVKRLTGFPLQITAIVPFELIALAFIYSNKVWLVWSFCRWNRFIRAYLIVDYLRKKSELLNINVYVMNMLRMIIRMTLVLQLLTFWFILTYCFNIKLNISPHVFCYWPTAFEKFDIFLRTYNLMTFILTGTSTVSYFPNSIYFICAYIIVAISYKFLFATFLSTMCNTIHMLLHKKVHYEQQIDQLKEYMTRERTSLSLVDRVWKYVKLLWRDKRGLQFPEFLEEAPYYLQEGILNSMYGCHLRRHKLLGRCHVDLIRQIAAQLRTRTFFPGDYVAFVNDIDECMYFIHEGAVVALVEDMYNEKIEMTLHARDMFGFDQGLYKRCGHEYTYRASRYSVVLVLKRNTWIHLLEFFPASKEVIYDASKQQEILENI